MDLANNIAPDELESIPEVSFEELDQTDEGEQLERVARELAKLNDVIAKRGVCRSDAAAIQMTEPSALNPKYPLNSYTEVPSKTNLTVTMDSVMTTIRVTAQRIWEWLCDQMIKLWNWVMTSKTDPVVVKEEATLADQKMTSAMKVAKANEDTNKVRQVLTGQKPEEVARIKENEESTYTNLVKVCYQEPEWIITVLAYIRNYTRVLQATNTLYFALAEFHNQVKSAKTEDQVLAAETVLEEQKTQYTAVVGEVFGYMFKLRNPLMQFEVVESPIETLSNLFRAFQAASKTRHRTPLEVDYPTGLKQVTNARYLICDFGKVVKEQASKDERLYEELRRNQTVLAKYKPRDLEINKLYRTNRRIIERAIENRKRTLSMIKDVQSVGEKLPELIISSIRKHIRASIQFANAVKVELSN